jgi:hypothetical protein
MNKIIKNYFLLMLFSPIWAYLSSPIVEYKDYYHMLGITTLIVYFIFFTDPTRIKNQYIPKYLFPLYLLFIYYFIWDLYNGNLQTYGWLKILLRNKVLYTIILFIIIENTHFNKKFLERALEIIKITIVIAFLVSVYQFLIDSTFFVPIEFHPNVTTDIIYHNRLPSIFGFIDQNDIGLSFLPLFSLYLGYQFYKKRKVPIFSIFMVGVVSLATNGRYVIFNFFVILSQYVFYKKPFFLKYAKLIFFSSFILIAVYYTFTYLGYNFYDFAEKRLFANIDPETNSRILAIRMFTIFFPKEPVFGTGVLLTDEIRTAISGRSSQIHVGYLAHLVSYGIVGSVFLYTFWGLLVKNLYKTAKTTSYYGSFFAFIVFLIANLTFPHHDIYNYGLIVTFIFNKYFCNTILYEKKMNKLSNTNRILL